MMTSRLVKSGQTTLQYAEREFDALFHTKRSVAVAYRCGHLDWLTATEASLEYLGK